VALPVCIAVPSLCWVQDGGAATDAKLLEHVDLRERLRGIEPALGEMLRQASVSQPGREFPSRRRRRNR